MSKFWNAENSAEAVELYTAGTPIEEIVEKLEAKSNRVVIGKLVSEGVYTAPEKPARKTPVDEGPTKADILEELVAKGVNVEGAKGANKDFLKHINTLIQ